MAEIIEKTVTTQDNGATAVVATPARVTTEATSFQTVEYLVYFMFGTLEILLAFRLILKLMGANAGSAFVGLIYGITGVFILPFQGIFQRDTAFEPSTLVAIVVYAVLAWGIVKLVQVLSGEKQTA